jgi:hypothetical protein
MTLLRRLFVLLVLGSRFAIPGMAAGPVALDQGLTYLRISSLTQSARELDAALLQPAPLVLDLRYTADEPDAANVLRVLNRQPRKPALYVLVSPATPKALGEILATAATPVTLLGIKGSRPEPAVVVAQSAADDRRAYDALAAGTPLAELISGKVEKDRFDEASLVTEFKNGNHDAHPPETPAGGKAAPAAPLVDRVLQRAAHLHRALLALKPRG